MNTLAPNPESQLISRRVSAQVPGGVPGRGQIILWPGEIHAGTGLHGEGGNQGTQCALRESRASHPRIKTEKGSDVLLPASNLWRQFLSPENRKEHQITSLVVASFETAASIFHDWIEAMAIMALAGAAFIVADSLLQRWGGPMDNVTLLTAVPVVIAMILAGVVVWAACALSGRKSRRAEIKQTLNRYQMDGDSDALLRRLRPYQMDEINQVASEIEREKGSAA